MESKLDKLRELRLTMEKMDSSLSVEMKELLSEHAMKAYLKLLGEHLDASNAKVTASIFMKRYAFLPVIYLYAMTAWNEKLDTSYDNVSLETKDDEKLWLPGIRFGHLDTEEFELDRDKWRIECIETLFKEHISPLIDRLYYTTKVSKLILWENIAVYLFWLYEAVFMEEDIPKEIQHRAKEDFQFIVFQASGNMFGNYVENPLTRYYNERLYVEELGKEIRKRDTCCYSHLTNMKKRCATCPLISKEKRVK